MVYNRTLTSTIINTAGFIKHSVMMISKTKPLKNLQINSVLRTSVNPGSVLRASEAKNSDAMSRRLLL